MRSKLASSIAILLNYGAKWRVLYYIFYVLCLDLNLWILFDPDWLFYGVKTYDRSETSFLRSSIFSYNGYLVSSTGSTVLPNILKSVTVTTVYVILIISTIASLSLLVYIGYATHTSKWSSASSFTNIKRYPSWIVNLFANLEYYFILAWVIFLKTLSCKRIDTIQKLIDEANSFLTSNTSTSAFDWNDNGGNIQLVAAKYFVSGIVRQAICKDIDHILLSSVAALLAIVFSILYLLSLRFLSALPLHSLPQSFSRSSFSSIYPLTLLTLELLKFVFTTFVSEEHILSTQVTFYIIALIAMLINALIFLSGIRYRGLYDLLSVVMCLGTGMLCAELAYRLNGEQVVLRDLNTSKSQQYGVETKSSKSNYQLFLIYLFCLSISLRLAIYLKSRFYSAKRDTLINLYYEFRFCFDEAGINTSNMKHWIDALHLYLIRQQITLQDKYSANSIAKTKSIKEGFEILRDYVRRADYESRKLDIASAIELKSYTLLELDASSNSTSSDQSSVPPTFQSLLQSSISFLKNEFRISMGSKPSSTLVNSYIHFLFTFAHLPSKAIHFLSARIQPSKKVFGSYRLTKLPRYFLQTFDNLVSQYILYIYLFDSSTHSSPLFNSHNSTNSTPTPTLKFSPLVDYLSVKKSLQISIGSLLKTRNKIVVDMSLGNLTMERIFSAAKTCKVDRKQVIRELRIMRNLCNDLSTTLNLYKAFFCKYLDFDYRRTRIHLRKISRKYFCIGIIGQKYLDNVLVVSMGLTEENFHVVKTVTHNITGLLGWRVASVVNKDLSASIMPLPWKETHIRLAQPETSSNHMYIEGSTLNIWMKNVEGHLIQTQLHLKLAATINSDIARKHMSNKRLAHSQNYLEHKNAQYQPTAGLSPTLPQLQVVFSGGRHSENAIPSTTADLEKDQLSSFEAEVIGYANMEQTSQSAYRWMDAMHISVLLTNCKVAEVSPQAQIYFTPGAIAEPHGQSIGLYEKLLALSKCQSYQKYCVMDNILPNTGTLNSLDTIYKPSQDEEDQAKSLQDGFLCALHGTQKKGGIHKVQLICISGNFAIVQLSKLNFSEERDIEIKDPNFHESNLYNQLSIENSNVIALQNSQNTSIVRMKANLPNLSPTKGTRESKRKTPLINYLVHLFSLKKSLYFDIFANQASKEKLTKRSPETFLSKRQSETSQPTYSEAVQIPIGKKEVISTQRINKKADEEMDIKERASAGLNLSINSGASIITTGDIFSGLRSKVFRNSGKSTGLANLLLGLWVAIPTIIIPLSIMYGFGIYKHVLQFKVYKEVREKSILVDKASWALWAGLYFSQAINNARLVHEEVIPDDQFVDFGTPSILEAENARKVYYLSGLVLYTWSIQAALGNLTFPNMFPGGVKAKNDPVEYFERRDGEWHLRMVDPLEVARLVQPKIDAFIARDETTWPLGIIGEDQSKDPLAEYIQKNFHGTLQAFLSDWPIVIEHYFRNISVHLYNTFVWNQLVNCIVLASTILLVTMGVFASTVYVTRSLTKILIFKVD
jgi:hypothetical protein